MKKLLLFMPIPIILALVWSFAPNWLGLGKAQYKYQGLAMQVSLPDSTILRPQEIHQKRAILLTNLLTYHYTKHPLDDKISEAAFDAYLKLIDSRKQYFTAADVEKFKQYRDKLDDMMTQGDVNFAYDVFNLYRQRVIERTDKTLKALDQALDFNTDEVLDVDRDKSPWAKSGAELDEIWRKQIKNEILSLVLSGKKIDEARDILKKRYQRVRKSMYQFNSEDVFQYFLNALTESYDPHTNYFSPVNAQNFNMNMSKSFEGIGARLQSREDYTIINEVMPGGPAFKGKELKKDDKIIGVAQGDEGEFEDVIGWRLDDVVSQIRGQKGTVVRLKIIPAAAAADAPPKIIRLVRDKIKIEDESASKKLITVKQGTAERKIGVIEIPSFYINFKEYQAGNEDYKSTSRDVKKLLEELKAEGAEAVVIDLRNNGGGSLKEAIDLTGLFITDGPVVQVRNTEGDVKVDRDRDASVTWDGPMAVMVNEFSASASEIFAGAIQDYKRGIIIGEQTYGKGTVQSPIDLASYLRGENPNQGQINLTLQKFYRITGSSTQNKGVMPDVRLPSLYDRDEVSESSERSALPWDEIKPSRYTPTERVNSDMVSKLNKDYLKRAKTDAAWQKLVKEIEDAKAERKKKQISLNEAKRRAELQAHERRQAELKRMVSEDGTEDEKEAQNMKDNYLRVALDVVADMLSLVKK